MRGTLVAAAVALAAGQGKPVYNPCTASPYNGQPWCNVTLDVDTRVADLLTRIPVADKIGMFNTASGGSSAVGIASYQWWNEVREPGVWGGGGRG
jgi:beta-glucosidase